MPAMAKKRKRTAKGKSSTKSSTTAPCYDYAPFSEASVKTFKAIKSKKKKSHKNRGR